MPNRVLREGILRSEAVIGLDWGAEVFLRRLMSVVDDFGRFHAGAQLLRAACYPLQIDQVSNSDIERWLTSCVSAGLVEVFPGPDSKPYLELHKFRQHVRTKKSRFPSNALDAPQLQPIRAADEVQKTSASEVEVSPMADDASPKVLAPDMVPDDWDSTREGVEEMAAQLNLPECQVGEPFPAFRQRVRTLYDARHAEAV